MPKPTTISVYAFQFRQLSEAIKELQAALAIKPIIPMPSATLGAHC